MSRPRVKLENNKPDLKGSNGDRDSQGRFVKGSKGGPGNPGLKRLSSYRKAIQAAIKPADLKKVMIALLGKAKKADVIAIRELLDRVVGKALPAPETSSAAIQLPELKNAESCVEALGRIFKGISSGAVSMKEATGLAAIVETSRKAIELYEIEQRLNQLEQRFGGDTNNEREQH